MVLFSANFSDFSTILTSRLAAMPYFLAYGSNFGSSIVKARLEVVRLTIFSGSESSLSSSNYDEDSSLSELLDDSTLRLARF